MPLLLLKMQADSFIYAMTVKSYSANLRFL